MYAAVGLLVLFVIGCLGNEATSSTEPAVVCTPKGLLKLDKPFLAPATHKSRLPFCSKFGCGCCGQRSVRVIARAVTEGYSDDSLPDACRAVLEDMYCSVCDAMVGSDLLPVCEDTCKLWWAACKDAFFSVDSTGHLLPCGGPASTRLICSQLKAVAPGPQQLCTMAGYTISSNVDPTCYNGTPSNPLDLCASQFTDPDAHIFEDDSNSTPARSTLAALIESSSDIRTVLRGVMVIAFLTFVVKRFVLRNQQHQVMMQRLELHQQRMRLQNQQRAATAAAAIARQEMAAREKDE